MTLESWNRGLGGLRVHKAWRALDACATPALTHIAQPYQGSQEQIMGSARSWQIFFCTSDNLAARMQVRVIFGELLDFSRSSLLKRSRHRPARLRETSARHALLEAPCSRIAEWSGPARWFLFRQDDLALTMLPISLTARLRRLFTPLPLNAQYVLYNRGHIPSLIDCSSHIPQLNRWNQNQEVLPPLPTSPLVDTPRFGGKHRHDTTAKQSLPIGQDAQA